MNPAPAQGLGAGRPNAPNAPVAGGPNRQQGPPLYRPEMMRTTPFLLDDEKIKYEKGLAGLWKIHDAAMAGSPQQEEAKKKIAEFGKMLVTKINQRRQLNQQQQAQQQAQQQGQQGQQGQQPQQQRPQQPLQQPGQAGPAPLVQQVPAGPVGNVGNPQPQTPAAGVQASPSMGAATTQARSLPPHIVAHINEMQFLPPANIQDKAKWLEEIKQKYARALFSMENARGATKSIDQTLQTNQALSADERKKLEERKMQVHKQYTDAISFANLVRKQYATGGNQRPAQNGVAGGPNAAAQARPQGVVQAGPGAGVGVGVNNGTAGAVPVNTMQNSTATVNAAIEAAKKQQLAAGRAPGPVNAQQGPPPTQAQTPATPAQAQQSPITQVAPAQPVAPKQQQVHQPQPLHHPAAPVKIEPGTQQQLPTPLNTALAAAAAGNIPSVGTPTQNSARLQTPQSATPTTAGASIRPLTHAAAVNLAASQPRPGASALPPNAAAGPGNAPATGLGGIGAAGQQPQQGHPHAHPPQAQPTAPNLPSKLPIPKVLHEKATQMPTPVASIGGIGSAGRPTYSGGGGIGGGVMNQPALPKVPAYQLDGEGERILNKKKLDELVRQVCGGTAEGQEGNMLTPEVEEVSSLFISAARVSPEMFFVFILADPLSYTVRPDYGRFLRRQRAAPGVPQRQGARVQGARDPRHPARAGAHLQHPHPGLLERGAADGAQGAAQQLVD